ncbi:hypothetical protein J2X65_002564 [Ancylobacter sp. 3268]|uniref:hypothetical protein n=1 Tax=Ancylobacter sp. 3268 TaxID=2817752 RepID=UPI0028611DEE|nr:hypothetical protein [Ancylobacter sp. 3268]MDR6953203.1 hypothetical protein [Ancylobacter sp. 3268]
MAAFPGLTGRGLFRKLKDGGQECGYTAVTDSRGGSAGTGAWLRSSVETDPTSGLRWISSGYTLSWPKSRRHYGSSGLFFMALGYRRLILVRLVLRWHLPRVQRCHCVAFDAIGDVLREVLYDRMKAAAAGKGCRGHYPRSQSHRTRCFDFHPTACRPHRLRTKSKVRQVVAVHSGGLFLARFFAILTGSYAIGWTPSPTCTLTAASPAAFHCVGPDCNILDWQADNAY